MMPSMATVKKMKRPKRVIVLIIFEYEFYALCQGRPLSSFVSLTVFAAHNSDLGRHSSLHTIPPDILHVGVKIRNKFKMKELLSIDG